MILAGIARGIKHEADARLIAASPELLTGAWAMWEALSMVQRAVTGPDGPGTGGAELWGIPILADEKVRHALERGASAIARTEGRES